MKNPEIPAFPVPQISDGLSKREFFAIAIMAPLVVHIGGHYEATAKLAVRAADILIQELEQENSQ